MLLRTSSHKAYYFPSNNKTVGAQGKRLVGASLRPSDSRASPPCPGLPLGHGHLANLECGAAPSMGCSQSTSRARPAPSRLHPEGVPGGGRRVQLGRDPRCSPAAAGAARAPGRGGHPEGHGELGGPGQGGPEQTTQKLGEPWGGPWAWRTTCTFSALRRRPVARSRDPCPWRAPLMPGSPGSRRQPGAGLAPAARGSLTTPPGTPWPRPYTHGSSPGF